MKRFLLYLCRWQLSSPILALCLSWLEPVGTVLATVIANLIGGAIFYWVDLKIFRKDDKKNEDEE